LELFKIAGTIAINSQEAEEGMDKAKHRAKDTASSMEGSFAKIGSAALKVGKVVATGLAAGAAAIGALAKSSIDSFAEFEQLVGGSQLLFGDAYDFIADKAKNAYATVQMSQNDYLKQVNGFAVGLKTALGGDAQAAAELADKIITAEADIVAATGNSQEAVQNAFNGIMKGNFAMLDNLQLGITPTKEGFQEVIDKVNEWNKANGEATKYQIDNLADCQAALVDYVEMQGLAGYAANEASETIQGSLAAAKAAWQNLLTGVATDGADMDGLIEGLVTSVTTAANRIIPRLTQILGGLSTALAQLVPIISAELPGLLGKLLPSLTEAAVGLIGGLVAALPGLVTMLTTSVIPQLLGGVIEITNALIGALPGVIGALASALPTLLPQLIKGIITMITTLFSNFSQIIQPIIGALPDIIISVTEVLLENLPALIEGVIALVMGIVDATPEIIQSLVDMLPKIIEMLVTAMIACTPQLLKGAFQLVGGVIKSLPSLLASLITGAINVIVTYFSALWDGLGGVFSELASWFDGNVLQPIIEFFSGLWDSIKGTFNDAVAVGRKIINDIKQGISNAWSGLTSWFKKLWNNLFGNLDVNVDVDTGIVKPNGSNPQPPGVTVQGQFATGLDYVPFDGFIAELHKGEMVVPAAESEAIRNGVFSTADTSSMTNMLALILDAIREGNEKETVMKWNNREVGRMVKAVI
jgi:hypothetical protein